MSTHKNFDKICVVVIIMALILTVLFMNGESLGIQVVVDEDSESYSDSVYFTANDQDGAWDSSSATIITLTGSSAQVSGTGAYVYDGSVYISNGGQYVISGTLDDGSIVVDAYQSSKVWLLLNGAAISSSDNAAICVEQADKVFLTLADGTENTLTGGSELSDEALDDGVYGVIFSHDDLTINGGGLLTVTANYKHGIKANDDLVITGGIIEITAPADGIHVNDSFRMMTAELTITGGDDGILVENEDSYFYMESGSVSVSSGDDAIHSNGDILVAGGAVTIDAGDDGLHADGNCEINNGSILINSCYEGIEAVNIDVSGGDIVIYPTDDGFNANGGSSRFGNFGGGAGFEMGANSFNPMGSDFNSADNTDNLGTDEDATETNEDGSGSAGFQGPDGAEAFSAPENGTGQNGFGGNAPADNGMFGGMETFDRLGEAALGGSAGDMESGFIQTGESTEEASSINISGGSITIINTKGNDADGFDSNGSIYISGGDIRISLTNNGTNSAIDYASENGGVCEISGGTVIACGSSSMAEAFDSTSSQCSILYNISSGVSDGAVLEVEDSEGNILLSWEVPCGFSSTNISCPELELGETYAVVIGDNEESITLSEASASYGDAQSSMFGGNMNWGGMQQRGGKGGDTSTGRPNGMGDLNRGERPDSSADTQESELQNGQNEFGQNPMPQGQNNESGAEPTMPSNGQGAFPFGNDASGEINSETDSSETPSFSEGGTPGVNEQQHGMNGQPPDMSGESENRGHTARPGQNSGRKFTNEDRSNNITLSDTSTQGQTEIVYTAEIYIKMALCILVLAAGLIFAKMYRKY